ncbi:MAG TPA: DUF6266 family protein [Prolixibacteraceae bacterium]|jgi:hypothetical protein
MARILSNSIFGPISGALGDLVYSSWKGIQYVRSKPVHVVISRTAAQLEQRARFAFMLKFIQPLKDFLRVGFKSQTAKMSAFNAAMSWNYRNALGGTFPDFAVDCTKVGVSLGPLTGALNPEVRMGAGGKLEFAWEDNSNDRYSMPNDRVMLLVYHPAGQLAETLIGGNTRRSGGQAIDLPASFSGKEVHCYMAFQNDSQRLVSNSQYVGSLNVGT